MHEQQRCTGATARLALLVLVVLPTLAYLPALRGGFIWDDDAHVANNLTLRKPDALYRIWLEPGEVPQYYPLVHTVFWLQYHAFGHETLGYHLVNLAQHVLSALILWRILTLLGVPGALLGAAIFALHPVHVESVAWITELKNTQSLLLYLAAAWIWLHFDPGFRPGREAETSRAWRWYVPALLLFAGAVMSKTVTASLPAAILVLAWWRHGRVRWRDVWPVLPMFALGVLGGAITIWMEKHFVGAGGQDFDFTWLQRVLIAGRAVWFYAWKLVLPVNLIFSYPRWDIEHPAWWWYAMPPALVVLAVLLAWKARPWGRSPLAAMLLFIGTLTPALGFFDVYPFVFSFVADHFQYHASAALIALIAAGLTLAWRRWFPRGRLAAAALLLVLGLLSFKQCFIYRDLETLWRDTIARNPSSWLALNNLATLLNHYGRFGEALPLAERAVELNPRNVNSYNNAGKAAAALGQLVKARDYYWMSLQLHPGNANVLGDMGTLLLQDHRPQESLKWFEDALQVDPDHLGALVGYGRALGEMQRDDEALRSLRRAVAVAPQSGDAAYFLGARLAALGRHAEAVAQLQRAVEIVPELAEGHNNLGVSLLSLGRAKDAAAAFKRALREMPDLAEAQRNLAAATAALGQPAEAISLLRDLLRRNPEDLDTVAALANLLAQAGQVEASIGYYDQVVRRRPDDAAVRNNFGTALAALHRVDEAIAQYEAALRIRPDYADAHNNLAAALDSVGRSDEAELHYRQAIEHRPAYADARYNLGLLLVRREQWQEAEQQFAAVLRLRPGNVFALYQMALVQEGLGRPDAAQRLLEQILLEHPREPLAMARLALIRCRSGEANGVAAAVEQAKQAVNLTRQQNAEVLSLLAQVLDCAGRRQQAVIAAEQAQRVARAHGQMTLVQEIEARLVQWRAPDQP